MPGWFDRYNIASPEFVRQQQYIASIVRMRRAAKEFMVYGTLENEIRTLLSVQLHCLSAIFGDDDAISGVVQCVRYGCPNDPVVIGEKNCGSGFHVTNGQTKIVNGNYIITVR